MTAGRDGDSIIVERRALADDAQSAADAGQREDPQEEPVQHHRDELPILDDLRQRRESGKLAIF